MKNIFHKIIEKTERAKFLMGSTVEERREKMPPVKLLGEKYISNCRLVENRYKMLGYMPKKAICAEIGIWKCNFSDQILKMMQPQKLHLIDIDETAIKIADQKFNQDILDGKIATHLGDSAKTIMSMPDNYFDWVYIDGDHSYQGVKQDLNAARLKLKPDGLIAMNDYIFFGPLRLVKYGVIEAVNEFCIEHDFELIYLAFQGRMYNDVVLRKI